jgi:hypothetical protein
MSCKAELDALALLGRTAATVDFLLVNLVANVGLKTTEALRCIFESMPLPLIALLSSTLC